MSDWSGYLLDLLKDGVAYFWFVILALWGGTASYLSRMKQKKLPFSLAELLGEWLISGFSGIMTALICASYGVDYYLTAAFAGIAGHMGGRGVYMFEQWAINRVKNMTGQGKREP